MEEAEPFRFQACSVFMRVLLSRWPFCVQKCCTHKGHQEAENTGVFLSKKKAVRREVIHPFKSSASPYFCHTHSYEYEKHEPGTSSNGWIALHERVVNVQKNLPLLVGEIKR